MKTYWIIGFLIAAGLPIHAKDCGVNVYVLATVPMPDGVLLAPAQSKAVAMFKEIGVNLRIKVGNPAHDTGDCGAPIVMQLDDSASYNGGREALAYAAPYKTAGTCIHILLDRVMRRNRETGFISTLLAHVMVHEITHVLEQSMRHSEEGVMKARWNRQDYVRMNWHSLPFDPTDAEFVREGAARRTHQPAVSKVADGNSPT